MIAADLTAHKSTVFGPLRCLEFIPKPHFFPNITCDGTSRLAD